MNTQTTSGTSPQVVDLLESAHADIEQYQKQLGLDQASVQERYDNLKEELRTAVSQIKDMVSENRSLSREIANALRERLTSLEEQVNAQMPKLTEAELLEQLVRIRRVMTELIRYLGGLSFYDLSLASIHDRIYRLQIKLAILRLKFQLGAMETKDKTMDLRRDVKKRIHQLRETAQHSEEAIEKRWDIFRHEVTAAYEHLQKAFTSK